jgi:hypothetical protein
VSECSHGDWFEGNTSLVPIVAVSDGKQYPQREPKSFHAEGAPNRARRIPPSRLHDRGARRRMLPAGLLAREAVLDALAAAAIVIYVTMDVATDSKTHKQAELSLHT